MALYIPHSIFHLALLLYVRPETFGPYFVDVLYYGCGSVSRTFGVLVSGCLHTHVNCKLECIRFILMRMLIYQTIVDGILNS